MVWALAVIETISYSVLYYSFAAFRPSQPESGGSSEPSASWTP
jgi:hypothetical protein